MPILKSAHCIKMSCFSIWDIVLKANTRNSQGVPMASNYAYLLIDYLRRKTAKKPLMWLCYIGIFFIWTYDEKSLSNFFSFADSLMANYTMKSHIKFKTNISTTNINFLDAKVTFKNGKRIYLICYKPSDAHLYLYWSSCHL